MTHLKIHSITKWVRKLKKDRILAIICGFDPDDVSFYDFLNRFWLSNNEPRKIMPPHKKPSNQAEKLPPKHPNVFKNIIDRIINGREVSLGPQRVISLLFSEVAVKPSIKMGLSEPNAKITSDGVPIESPSNPYGKRICVCSKKGARRCGCKRHFSDPSARWGWDSNLILLTTILLLIDSVNSTDLLLLST
jgi:hypothetical protein